MSHPPPLSRIASAPASGGAGQTRSRLGRAGSTVRIAKTPAIRAGIPPRDRGERDI